MEKITKRFDRSTVHRSRVISRGQIYSQDTQHIVWFSMKNGVSLVRSMSYACSIYAKGALYAVSCFIWLYHDTDVIMGAIASQIASLTIYCSTVHSDTDQRKHQSSASLAFVWGIHREPVNSPHKWPVTRKMFPFDDVTMIAKQHCISMFVSEFARAATLYNSPYTMEIHKTAI